MSDIRESQQREGPRAFITFTDPGFAPIMENISTADPNEGQVIGDFKILDKIGEGAMAIVFRAKQISTGRIVAMKTLRYAEQDLSARFAREVSIHNKLRHPNIVEAIDCITTPQGRTYFVMKYLNGVTLEDQLVKHGRCKNPVVFANILSQICDALEVAHHQGIIHRDIKPENIILLDSPNGKQIKVLDFGVAKIQEDLQRLTKTGVVLGSPAYMSPEQCMGMDLDSRSDLYSLGVVAYELVTGGLPFDAETPVEMMESHCDPDIKPMPLGAYRPDFPALAELQRVFDHVLQTEVNDRTATISEFKRELEIWWTKAMGEEAPDKSPFEIRELESPKVQDKNKSVLNTVEVRSLENLTGRRIGEEKKALKPAVPKNMQLPLLIGGVVVTLIVLMAFLATTLLSTIEGKNQPAQSNSEQNR